MGIIIYGFLVMLKIFCLNIVCIYLNIILIGKRYDECVWDVNRKLVVGNLKINIQKVIFKFMYYSYMIIVLYVNIYGN